MSDETYAVGEEIIHEGRRYVCVGAAQRGDEPKGQVDQGLVSEMLAAAGDVPRETAGMVRLTREQFAQLRRGESVTVTVPPGTSWIAAITLVRDELPPEE